MVVLVTGSLGDQDEAVLAPLEAKRNPQGSDEVVLALAHGLPHRLDITPLMFVGNADDAGVHVEGALQPVAAVVLFADPGLNTDVEVEAKSRVERMLELNGASLPGSLRSHDDLSLGTLPG